MCSGASIGIRYDLRPDLPTEKATAVAKPPSHFYSRAVFQRIDRTGTLPRNSVSQLKQWPLLVVVVIRLLARLTSAFTRRLQRLHLLAKLFDFISKFFEFSLHRASDRWPRRLVTHVLLIKRCRECLFVAISKHNQFYFIIRLKLTNLAVEPLGICNVLVVESLDDVTLFDASRFGGAIVSHGNHLKAVIVLLNLDSELASTLALLLIRTVGLRASLAVNLRTALVVRLRTALVVGLRTALVVSLHARLCPTLSGRLNSLAGSFHRLPSRVDPSLSGIGQVSGILSGRLRLLVRPLDGLPSRVESGLCRIVQESPLLSGCGLANSHGATKKSGEGNSFEQSSLC